MKIISKRNSKDYYDFLTGLYGVDPKVVYRRPVSAKPLHTFDTILHVYLCGEIIDGFYSLSKKRYYWGMQLLEIGTALTDHWDKYHINDSGRNSDDYVKVKYENYHGYMRDPYIILCTVPYKDKRNRNEAEKQPIFLRHNTEERGDGTETYPKLKDLGFERYMDPKTIYLKIAAWLAPKDPVPDQVDDKTKLLSHGFDLKTSFRGKIKKDKK